MSPQPWPFACRGCGCTDDHACPGGCFWVEPDLCSACAAALPPLVIVTVAERPRDIFLERGLQTLYGLPTPKHRGYSFPRTRAGVRAACAMLALDVAAATVEL